MNWEDPDQLLKLKLSREEYCQRSLTSLILRGPDPGHNKHERVSDAGHKFLTKLYTLTKGNGLGRELKFVNEIKLSGEKLEQPNGWPDYGVVTDRLLWIIELKTEAKSHKPSQLASYQALGKSNYPQHDFDLLYLTPEMNRISPSDFHDCRFAHFFWSEILKLIAGTWSGSPHAEERRLCRVLVDELSDLGTVPGVFRSRRDVVGDALTIAANVQETGQQQAVEIVADGMEGLVELRSRIGRALERSADAPNVKPWIWNTESSGGKALTEMGSMVGFELRLSKYKSA